MFCSRTLLLCYAFWFYNLSKLRRGTSTKNSNALSFYPKLFSTQAPGRKTSPIWINKRGHRINSAQNLRIFCPRFDLGGQTPGYDVCATDWPAPTPNSSTLRFKFVTSREGPNLNFKFHIYTGKSNQPPEPNLSTRQLKLCHRAFSWLFMLFLVLDCGRDFERCLNCVSFWAEVLFAFTFKSLQSVCLCTPPQSPPESTRLFCVDFNSHSQ